MNAAGANGEVAGGVPWTRPGVAAGPGSGAVAPVIATPQAAAAVAPAARPANTVARRAERCIAGSAPVDDPNRRHRDARREPVTTMGGVVRGPDGAVGTGPVR